MYDLLAFRNNHHHINKIRSSKNNNVYRYFNNKSKHYLNRKNNSHSKIHNLCSYFSSKTQNIHKNHSFSTNCHLGLSIKWWEDSGYKTQRNNVILNITQNLTKTSYKLYSKQLMYVFYRFKHMAEISFTKIWMCA